MQTPTEMPVRYVVVREARYLRAEDVVALIRAMATTEETDVRNRLNELADHVSSI